LQKPQPVGKKILNKVILAGAEAYGKDVPSAEIHILDAGHFALDQRADEIARLTKDFLDRQKR
jgi:pimeloyl-ACP methyl ester carboxylesterase